MALFNGALQSVANNDYFKSKQDAKQLQLISEIKNSGDIQTVSELIQNGASINTPYQDETPLSAAMYANRYSIFILLIERLKADTSFQYTHINKHKYPLIWYALWENKNDYFKILVNHEKRDLRDPANSQTLLMQAVKQLNIEAVGYCLEARITNVNAVDKHRKTALHYALACPKHDLTEDRKQIIKMLIDSGAMTDIRDFDNNTAMDVYKKATELREIENRVAMEQANNPKPKNEKKQRKRNTYNYRGKQKGSGAK